MHYSGNNYIIMQQLATWIASVITLFCIGYTLFPSIQSLLWSNQHEENGAEEISAILIWYHYFISSKFDCF